jgi:hypothetical protein
MKRLLINVLRQCRASDPFGLPLGVLAIGVALEELDVSLADLAAHCDRLTGPASPLLCKKRGRYYITKKGLARIHRRAEQP